MRLPTYHQGDTGKVVDPSRPHGEAKIEEAPAGAVPEERMVVPIAPAPFAPATLAPAKTPAAPPERQVVPVENPEAPMAAPLPPVQEPTSGKQPSAAAAKLAATAAKLAATAAQLAEIATKLAAAAAQASAPQASRPAHGESPAAATAPTEGAPTAAPTALQHVPPPEPRPAGEANPATVTLDEAVFDQIRLEIKSRLPYFQACADAARRRGSAEVRRVQATWTIAADGAIKEMKVEGVPDAQLATCITRMGSRPFKVQPGTELTIPTPIVFVR